MGDDILDGGPGDDRLHGHGGSDSLTGGPGRDRMRADAGADHLLDATSLDSLACGAGPDLVGHLQTPFLRPDCETLQFAFGPDGRRATSGNTSMPVAPHPVLSSTGRSLRVTVSCPVVHDSDGTCSTWSGRVRVATPGGLTLGTARLVGPPGNDGEAEDVTVTVRLNETGRRIAAAGGILRISLRGTNLPTGAWKARALRATSR